MSSTKRNDLNLVALSYVVSIDVHKIYKICLHFAKNGLTLHFEYVG